MSHRFYLPPGEWEGDLLILSDREAHHALHVLRVRPGEEIGIWDGAGRRARCEIVRLGRDEVTARILDFDRAPRLPPAITLLQAMPKGKAFELIVEKATELGADRIIPILTERVVVHFDEEEKERKLSKWHLIAVDAMKQCGNPWLPVIEKPAGIDEILVGQSRWDIPLVASLESGDHPRKYFEDFRLRHGAMPTSIAIWVGPEGDFTPAEMGRIMASGVSPITLGPLVLRAETAAIYGLSVVSYESRSDPHRPGKLESLESPGEETIR